MVDGSGRNVNVAFQATGTDGLPHQIFLRELRQFNVLENICNLPRPVAVKISVQEAV